jgi:glycosyltransferase involved in cell wall biosynthesis
VLLFSAQVPTSRRKGADLLIRALQELPTEVASRTVLLTMGERGAELAQGAGLPARDLGYLDDDHLKAIAYSAADLFLFPTRADVFGLVSIESQACGTPVVSFRAGGVPDHVRPGETGWLAEPEDALGFRDGIALLLENETVRRRMSETCRQVVLQDYDLTLETTRHLDLYDSILSDAGSAGNLSGPPLVPPYPGFVEESADTGQDKVSEHVKVASNLHSD